MSGNNHFIGMGHNPDPNVPDLPTGLGMALFQNPEARAYFENLSDAQKTGVISYVQNGNVTGADAKFKVKNAVEQLGQHSIEFTNSYL